ncbi:MAG TPA: GIY-YIG nuclease family protein [Spirochaetota bacterium]|nr:GIY-YIG nuclease family protein [Spirochaetota bacterium]HPJ37675.1 GIY-YIG nuclease family protein [Spirochaetota bacterium]HPQ53530.1 GIY-YIG nuclease family protein [Spirochaetota bacterium]
MKTEPHDSDCCWIYILECSNNTLYTGYTTDIIKRYRTHIAGKVKYTRGFKPRKIAQCWRLFDTKGTAMKIEHFIKKMDRGEKLDLIHNPLTLRLLVEKHFGSNIHIAPDDSAVIEKAARDTGTIIEKNTADRPGKIPLK